MTRILLDTSRAMFENLADVTTHSVVTTPMNGNPCAATFVIGCAWRLECRSGVAGGSGKMQA
jgi:hypothetical protein